MRYILIIITVLFSLSSTAFARYFNACDDGKTYIDAQCIDNKLLPEVKTIKLNEINQLDGKIELMFNKLNNIATSIENGSDNQSNNSEIKSLSKDIIEYVDIKLDTRKSMYAYLGDEYSDGSNSSTCMKGRREECMNKGKGQGQGRCQGKGRGQDRGKHNYNKATDIGDINNNTVVANTNTVNYNAKKEDAMNNDLMNSNARNYNAKNNNRAMQHGGCFHRGYTRVRDGIGLSVYKATFDLYSIFNKASVSNLHMREISNKHSAELQLLNDKLVSAFTNYDLYYSNLSGGKVEQKDIDRYRAEYLVAIENSINFLANTYDNEILKLSSENLEKVKHIRTYQFKSIVDRYNSKDRRTIKLIEKVTSQ